MAKTKKHKKENRLTPPQEKFCRYFVEDEELLGNGTLSYEVAYNIKREGNWYRTCSAAASRLLRSVKISARISELLNIYLNDNLVDNELAYTISQKADLGSKVAAIREYNRLKKRVSENPSITFNFKELFDVELEKRLKKNV